MDISIVIPAYKERNKIGDDISAAGKFLKENNFRGEIIVVDDGSKDGTAETARSASATLAGGATLEVIEHESHHGKGFAVRTGILRAKGDYIMFADSGSCVPLDNVLPGLELIRQGKCDIAHGSRKLPQSRIVIPQTLFRRISSRIFSVAAVYFMGMPKNITDSQCGFKIYSGKIAKDLYEQCKTDGFMFDAEILLHAVKNGLRICEFPVQWTCDRDSRLSAGKNTLRIFLEMLKIKRGM